MKCIGLFRRALAAAVVAALIWTSPGIGAFQALAMTGIAPVKVQVPVGGSVGAGGVATVGGVNGLGVPGMASGFAGNISLQSVLPLHSVQANPGSAGAALALPSSVIPTAADGPAVSAALSAPRPNSSSVLHIPGGGGPSIPVPGFRTGRTKSRSRGAVEDASGRFQGGSLVGRHGVSTPGKAAEAEAGGSLTGKTAWIAKRFAALRQAFGLKKDSSDLSPQAVVNGRLRGSAAAASIADGRVVRKAPAVALQAPASATVGSQVSGLKAPVRLVLRGSSGRRGDLRVVIEESPAAAAAKGAKDVALGAALTSSRSKARGAAEETEKAPAAQEKARGKKALWGIGTAAVMLIASVLVAQVGVEALGAAMPALVQKTFGDFTAVAQLAIFRSIAAMIGRQLAPMVMKRLGLRKSYQVTLGAQLVAVSLLAGLLATGHMTLPLMTLFFALNGLVTGMNQTILDTIPPALVGQKQKALERFRALRQISVETIGISGPIVTGAVIASFGFLPALIAFPVSGALALAIVFFTLRIPKKYEAMRKLELQKQAREEGKGFWSKMAYGAKLVWGNKVLRYSFLGYSAFLILNPFLYSMVGPAYGLTVSGMANPELGAAIGGWLTGLYSLGGMLGGLIMMAGQRKIEKQSRAMKAAWEKKHGPISDDEWDDKTTPWSNEILRKSMLRWMTIGALSLAAFAAMAFSGLPTLGALVALPSWLGWMGNLTLPALTLIPFGIAEVVAYLKLFSFFQTRVPNGERNMPDAMGFMGSAFLALSTVGMFGMKYLFKLFTGYTPFVIFAAGMIPLGLFVMYLRNRLIKHSAPESPGDVAPPIDVE